MYRSGELHGTQKMEIAGENLLKEYFPDVPISNILKFEGLANRDSLPYIETYGLGKLENLQTVLRGTLRLVTAKQFFCGADWK